MIIVSSHIMFTMIGMVTWVDVGGGCYIVVSKHGSTLGLDGFNVLCMSASCVSPTLAFHVLVAFS